MYLKLQVRQVDSANMRRHSRWVYLLGPSHKHGEIKVEGSLVRLHTRHFF